MPTIAALLDDLARRYAASIAVADAARSLDFATLERRARALAAALIQAGAEPGSCVAALVNNGVPMIELFMAAAKARVTLLPLNWRLAAKELDYILADAAPRLLFHSDGLADLAGRLSAPPRSILIADGGGDCAYETFLRTADPATPLPEPVPTDAWLMLYTSGTTGRPKGCLLDQGGQYAQALAMRDAWRATPQDRLGSCLPLFHVGGMGIFLGHFSSGATVHIAPRSLTAQDCLGWLSRLRVTTAAIPVQFYDVVIEQQRRAPLPLALRCVNLGGGMHATSFVTTVLEVLNVAAICGYGQTEAGGFVSMQTHEEQLRRPQSCGRVMPHLESRIADEADRPLPAGEVGELCVRGGSVMKGYWRQEAATAEALRHGWLHSGDMCRVDAEGYLFLVGRKKELIKSGGENVYPREVEEALSAHPAVLDCSVFAVPHEYWGEAVKAAVVLREGTAVSAHDLGQWCKQRIAGYKRPRYVEFLAAIPRSEIGKVQKLELAARPLTPEQSTD
jgi:acyl-CoA synthetase (AMP-forming)/AMP-acid ligase II